MSDDIKKLFEGLNKTPEPAKKNARQKAKDDEAARDKLKATWTPENLPIDAKALVIRTKLNRVVFNEGGITEAIAQLDRLPEKDEAIHMMMGGHFNGFDLIPAICRMAGKPLEDLHIATLGFNLRNNKNLCQMIDDGEITGQTVLVASQHFAQMDPNVYRQAKENLESRGGTMNSTRNHAKIIAAKCGESYFVCEGSANLRSCSSLEQLQVINSREIYDFHRKWIREIADHRET